MHGSSYRVEGCGIQDMTQFFVCNGISKDTPVSMHYDNLSGVQHSAQSDVPYRKWVGVDDDVYSTIWHDLCNSQWCLNHVKGHQDAKNIKSNLIARLNDEADKLAKEFLQKVMDNQQSSIHEGKKGL